MNHTFTLPSVFCLPLQFYYYCCLGSVIVLRYRRLGYVRDLQWVQAPLPHLRRRGFMCGTKHIRSVTSCIACRPMCMAYTVSVSRSAQYAAGAEGDTQA